MIVSSVTFASSGRGKRNRIEAMAKPEGDLRKLYPRGYSFNRLNVRPEEMQVGRPIARVVILGLSGVGKGLGASCQTSRLAAHPLQRISSLEHEPPTRSTRSTDRVLAADFDLYGRP